MILEPDFRKINFKIIANVCTTYSFIPPFFRLQVHTSINYTGKIADLLLTNLVLDTAEEMFAYYSFILVEPKVVTVEEKKNYPT